jgi:hypothetical protein
VPGDLAFGERFALAALATWRVTHLLAEEDGPANAVTRLRARLGAGPAGELLDCFYCLSAWTAAPLALGVVRRRRDVPLVWLALSGAACLLEQATFAPRTDEAQNWSQAAAAGPTTLRSQAPTASATA